MENSIASLSDNCSLWTITVRGSLYWISTILGCYSVEISTISIGWRPSCWDVSFIKNICRSIRKNFSRLFRIFRVVKCFRQLFIGITSKATTRKMKQFLYYIVSVSCCWASIRRCGNIKQRILAGDSKTS